MAPSELLGHQLRPAQAEILSYQGGRLAVSAVPGSGKTFTLGLLATRLITEGLLGNEGEVLVVTVQNSAVANISSRIAGMLTAQRFPPAGYHVCTLHKLASDILRTRHDLAGVEQGFSIVDGIETERMMQQAVKVYTAKRRPYWLSFLPDDEGAINEWVLNKWRGDTERLGGDVAKLCKHLRLSPERARALIPDEVPADALCHMGVALYELYETYLHSRGGLDFDDLIWRAIQALDQDPAFVENLRARWPYILEDEAQDSSPLQEEILSRLAGAGGNWVRVGDPNQSINATFTAADPRFFRRFYHQSGERALSLPQTGRCGQPIMDLANHLVIWACDNHPEPAIRSLALERQKMLPTSPGDAQQNPPAADCRIFIRHQPYDSNDVQCANVVASIGRHLGREPGNSVAVLCPSGWQGSDIVTLLERDHPDLRVFDMLKSTPRTRQVAKMLSAACAYLSAPEHVGRLITLFNALVDAGRLGSQVDLKKMRSLLRDVSPEELLFPRQRSVLQQRLAELDASDEDLRVLQTFTDLVARWVEATALSIDQLLLLLAQNLFEDERELAICHAIASSLEVAARMHPDWRLPDLARQVDDVAQNKRGLPGLSLADEGGSDEQGGVVVTTVHRAKGLEWDTVYILCTDSLEFPATCDDTFRDEPLYMPGRAPAVEARKRLEQLAGVEFADKDDVDLVRQAHLETIAERLRLLYVGITRAKRNLSLTWCLQKNHPSLQQSAAVAELGRFNREEMRR